MNVIEFLYASNFITRRRRTPEQRLAFAMLVENRAYDKQVEVRWRGETGDWQTTPAVYVAPAGDGRELWQATATVKLSEQQPLPGNVRFALRSLQDGREDWANNNGRNFTIEADAGLLLGAGHPVTQVDYTPQLGAEQRIVPVTIAVSGAAQRVAVEWSTDGWKSKHRTAATFTRRHWDQSELSNARNPNQYGVGVWTARLRIGEAYRVEYAVVAQVDGRELWNNRHGANYAAQRNNLKVLALNLHCYQEADQDAKLSRIAQAIDELGIDIVCLQEVAEHWNDGHGDWPSNTARIIHERVRGTYHLCTDWSHRGFDRYREGVAILSRYPFLRTEAQYVSASQDPYDIHARKVLFGRVNVPGAGHVNLFSAHLSWWSNGFREQFDTLRAWADRLHTRGTAATLLCGDFNIAAHSEGYAHVVETSDYEDQFLKATNRTAFDAVYRRRKKGWQRALDGDGRIDFVLMKRTGKLRPIAAQRVFNDDSYGHVSDHEGFLVTFEPA